MTHRRRRLPPAPPQPKDPDAPLRRIEFVARMLRNEGYSLDQVAEMLRVIADNLDTLPESEGRRVVGLN
ncbi:hypothetical protein ACK8OR_01830 [Jannaschia sp. KMU-145]|uniref:hypothetical protein n=1 Tax=Jannaschia halovivens TaxID=3388667 RepID=UPI00396B2753